MLYININNINRNISWFYSNNINLNAIKIVAAGIISLLEEPMPELKVFALKKLDMIVDEFWPEISEAIEKMYVGRNKTRYLSILIFLSITIYYCLIVRLIIR